MRPRLKYGSLLCPRTGALRFYSRSIRLRSEFSACGWGLALFVIASVGFAQNVSQADSTLDTKPQPGLMATFVALDGNKRPASDVSEQPNVQLYVPAGQSPTPFLPNLRFSAVWTGFIMSPTRGEYAFQAELNGDLKLEINGATVLETIGSGPLTAPSKPVRLNKGTNALTATFRSPALGDAFIRLDWIAKGKAPAPIPPAALLHWPGGPELKRANQLRLGRELWIERRCLKCHQPSASDLAIPELAMDAPSFEGIGARRRYAWLARWILNPKARRGAARMPQIFHGPKAQEEAEAIAAYLASLKSGWLPAVPSAAGAGGQVDAGNKLFAALHCAACHIAPEAAEDDPERLSLKDVPEKFFGDALVDFLRKPDAHYAWIRMPDFKLSVTEAEQLTAYLFGESPMTGEKAAPADGAKLERGRTLVQISGCLNCHALNLENRFAAKPLAELPPARLDKGCLAGSVEADSPAPNFAFSAEERQALKAFAATDRAAMARSDPVEFAWRQTRLLNCAGCHGPFDGIPPLEILGGKLKPEWVRDFISGRIQYKPRPWLEARMPAFPKCAEALAIGFAMRHGYPPQTPAEPTLDEQAAGIGRKLVSAQGGFSCVSCHAIGQMSATQPLENAGINLAYSGARLLKPYFEHWLRNPLAVEPTSKMPVFFDETGRSPLVDFYDGDRARQIEALWQYIRLGEKMAPPAN